MAFAPSLLLVGVPSASIMRRSSATWSVASSPCTVCAMSCVYIFNGAQHAFAEVARFVAIAQLERFVFARGGAARARRRGRACHLRENVGFNGGIAARIDDLARDEARDAPGQSRRVRR